MTWHTLTSPMLCVRCQQEQPAGAQMAAHRVGPQIQHMRCQRCESEVAAGLARITAERRKAVTNMDTGPLLPEFGRVPAKLSAFGELPQVIQDAQRRAAGDV